MVTSVRLSGGEALMLIARYFSFIRSRQSMQIIPTQFPYELSALSPTRPAVGQPGSSW